MLKSLVRCGLKRLGLEVRRTRSYHTDVEADERLLLAGGPVRTILDVGASVGETVARYRGTYPDAEVYCFEPTEGPYRQLQARHARDPRVHPMNAAVGEHAGRATLHLNSFDQCNSLLPTDTDLRAFLAPGERLDVGTVSVPVVRLDDFCREQGLSTVDLIKLDIQGFELSALRGAAKLLESGCVRVIQCEVLFSKLYKGQAFYHEVASYLSGHGYELWGLYHFFRIPKGPVAWADAIFMSPTVASQMRGAR